MSIVVTHHDGLTSEFSIPVELIKKFQKVKTYYDYDDTDRLKSIKRYNTKLHPDGKWESWWSNNELKSVRFYDNGKPRYKIKYFPTGLRSAVYKYDDEGRLHGKEHHHHTSGHLKHIKYWSHGKLLRDEYYKNGEINHICRWR